MNKVLYTALLCLLAVCAANAQNIKVENLKGEKVSFQEIIKGDKPVIVNFWATWCKPCLMEMEGLKELRDDWEGRVRIVSISINDARSSAKVNSFVKGNNYPFEIYKDPNQELYKHLNGVSVPYVLIFKDGKPVYRHTGYHSGQEASLLDEALKYAK